MTSKPFFLSSPPVIQKLGSFHSFFCDYIIFELATERIQSENAVYWEAKWVITDGQNVE